MAQKENKPIYASQKQLYEMAVQKRSADAVIVQHAYKIDNYNIAASMFDEVGDYLDAKEQAQQCRELAEKTREEETEAAYRRAVERFEAGSTWQDMTKVTKLAAQLEGLGSYKDAPRMLEHCNDIIRKDHKKHRIKLGCVLGILAAIIASVYIGIQTGYIRYAAGVVMMKYGKYSQAESIFRSMPGYRDSDAYVSQNERRKLLAAKEGDTVTFGEFKWVALDVDQEDGTLLLMGVEGKKYGTSNIRYHDRAGEVTWEDSSLRKWLNSEVLEGAFTEDERACMVQQENAPSENAEYGTGYAEQTEEYISILSAEECADYSEHIETMSVDFWLRTPGGTLSEAAFYDGASHSIKYFGYPVTEEITIRPTIRIDRSGLGDS